MSELPGVYTTRLKDGTASYRAGITVKSKHISLGSFDNPDDASGAYRDALYTLKSDCTIEDYEKISIHLPFKKYVILINLRDNGIYFNTPIYLYKKYFLYYVDRKTILTFDVDDLFYFSDKSIMKRGNHLFVAEYGMQTNILSRYGIRDHAVPGRDYYFSNGNPYDFRYGNVNIVNRYYGVQKIIKKGQPRYKTVIHINGNFVVGTYKTEEANQLNLSYLCSFSGNYCRKFFDFILL